MLSVNVLSLTVATATLSVNMLTLTVATAMLSVKSLPQTIELRQWNDGMCKITDFLEIATANILHGIKYGSLIFRLNTQPFPWQRPSKFKIDTFSIIW